ncbi:MAG: HAMP domain-containing histidine kinase [Ruminococcus flavefaciens]|nr:HAMP domain-containing histidine kinase [Ruminococcus flavefaciens]MCM1228817.1 HAMP domain-containing histidine kinase [Ruminococcus flavefaciens]
MKIKDSNYYKLFCHTMIIIFLVIMITGILVVSICSKMYENSRLNDLKNVGNFYINCVSSEYKSGETDYQDCLLYADNLSKKLADSHNLKIYLYDSDGKCVIPGNENMKLDESLRIRIAFNPEISELSNTSLSNNEPYLIFGKEFYLNPETYYTDLYLVVYGGTENIDKFTIQITLTYIVIALIAFLICFFLMKIKIHKNIVFENDFMRIIEKYTKGDFSEKLETDLSPNLKHISERVNTLASNFEKSEEISSTFIANVSHELRTPMTTIGGFVDGILDGTIKKSKQQEYLVLVSQEIQRLRILITSMLNMSRFESGTMMPNFRETNLTDLVIKVVLMFEKKIEDKQLEIEGLDSGRLVAVADSDLMQQVVYNLVENAVKFVNKGGTLSFSFDKKDDICIIGIKNTGEGLKDSEIQQVFNRFYKTDSSRGKDKTGLGLGLSISRKIVHLHNGHIVVKSVYGEYTEFQIQIPENLNTVRNDKKEK